MANSLINDKVLGGVLGAELPNKLKFAPIAVIDNTLVGVAGDTIKVEKYGYIGEASDVAEGAEIGLADLTMTSTDVTIKKAGQGFKLTDEEAKRRGQEVVNEGKKQLLMSMADHIDNDSLASLQGATIKKYTTTKLINYADIVKANAKFGEKSHDFKKYLYINTDQEAELVLSDKFIDSSKLADDVVENGVIGKIAGCYVIISDKIKATKDKKYKNLIVQEGALGIKMGKTCNIEEARSAKTCTTEYYANEMYTTYLRDESKVVVLECATEVTGA